MRKTDKFDLIQKQNFLAMKRIMNKEDVQKLGHKLHQLQKRLKRATENEYPDFKISERIRRIRKLQNTIRQATT
jgi:hypothetical protein